MKSVVDFPSVKMKFALSFAALLLGAGATPLANNDMVLDAILAEAAVVPRKVEHVVRVVDVQLAPQDQGVLTLRFSALSTNC